MNAPHVVAASGRQLLRTNTPWRAYGSRVWLKPLLNTREVEHLAHDARIRPAGLTLGASVDAPSDP
jgi:hypothetical protein